MYYVLSHPLLTKYTVGFFFQEAFEKAPNLKTFDEKAFQVITLNLGKADVYLSGTAVRLDFIFLNTL